VFAGLRRLEWVALVWIAVAASMQLFLHPTIGLADNGDFGRAMSWFHLKHTVTDYNDAYFAYFNAHYVFDRAVVPRGFFTSEAGPLSLAVGLNAVFRGPRDFDLRLLAAVYLVLLLASTYLLFRFSQQLQFAPRVIVAVATAIVLSDVGYISYFNSFYSEPASLIFLLASIAALLHLIQRPTIARLAGCTLLFLLLDTAKPQNVVIGVLLAAFIARMVFVQKSAAWRVSCVGAAVLTIATGVIYYKSMPDDLVRASHYIAVFKGILPVSPAPATDLAELGVPANFAKYSGTTPFDAGITVNSAEFQQDFYPHISMPKIAFYYARHPSRLAAVLDRVAHRALLLRPPFGNYEKSAGKPPRALAYSFAWWSSARVAIVSRSLVGIAAWSVAGLSLALITRRAAKTQQCALYAELFGIVILSAISQYLIVAIAQSTLEDIKHLYLFSFLFDACLVAVLAWSVDAAREWFVRRNTLK
jgi:hypothetical protein